jgi:hypothetical protein
LRSGRSREGDDSQGNQARSDQGVHGSHRLSRPRWALAVNLGREENRDNGAAILGDRLMSMTVKTFLIILVAVAMLATVGVLLAGAIGMARGQSPEQSNRLMQWRVLLQACALILFIILLSLLRS